MYSQVCGVGVLSSLSFFASELPHEEASATELLVERHFQTEKTLGCPAQWANQKQEPVGRLYPLGIFLKPVQPLAMAPMATISLPQLCLIL